MSLKEDAKLARSRGLTFSVCRQEGRGQRWQTVEDDLEDLEQAVEQAKAIDAWKSCVFVHHPPYGHGFFYWESHHPSLLNSSVIEMEIHYDEK